MGVRPDSPQVIEQTLLQLREQQSDGGLSVHADDALAGPQSRVSHIFILVRESLEDKTKRRRVSDPILSAPKKTFSH